MGAPAPDPAPAWPVWSRQTEAALELLEDLPPTGWLRIGELTTVHLQGGLSFEAWRTSTGAILEAAVRSGSDDQL